MIQKTSNRNSGRESNIFIWKEGRVSSAFNVGVGYELL